MYTYSIIITRNGQEIKKFLDFLPVLSIYFSIECQLLLEVKIITEEMINSDPYGYTYKEICDCVGEKKARSLMHALYKEKPQKKYQTMSINDIYNGGDTRKYSFKLKDGYCVETVCIKRKTGVTVCVSTMVGCPVGCIFCASGSNGFIRNLTPSEIVQQVTLLKEKVNRIVYMGMGEPFF